MYLRRAHCGPSPYRTASHRIAGSGVVRVALRLVDGRRIMRRFNGTDTLRVLYIWARYVCVSLPLTLSLSLLSHALLDT